MHAHGWLYVHVSQESPAQPAFRRRIPLELTAEEFAILEREEKRFASKRATLVAGLAALERLLAAERALKQAVRERDEAQAEAKALAEKTRKAAGALAKTKQEAKSAKRGRTAAERRAGETSAGAREEIEELEEILADERRVRVELAQRLEEADAQLLDGAYCPRCAEYAAAETWAAREDEGYELVYHRPCGFHPEDGLTKARSVFGYRTLS